ncbi:MAG: hypothetical protein WAU62_08605, partial [Dehalococcoidales bacterium]
MLESITPNDQGIGKRAWATSYNDYESDSLQLQEIREVAYATQADTIEAYQGLADLKMAKYLCLCDMLTPSKESWKADTGRALSLLVNKCFQTYLTQVGLKNYVTPYNSENLELLCQNCFERHDCYRLTFFNLGSSNVTREPNNKKNTNQISDPYEKARLGLLSIYLKQFKHADDEWNQNFRTMDPKWLKNAEQMAFGITVDMVNKIEECYMLAFETGASPILVKTAISENQKEYQQIITLDHETYKREDPEHAGWPQRQLCTDVRRIFPEGVIVAKNRAGNVLGYSIVLPMKPGFAKQYLSGSMHKIQEWTPKKDCLTFDEACRMDSLCMQVDNVNIFPHTKLRRIVLPRLTQKIKDLILTGNFKKRYVCAIDVSPFGFALGNVYMRKRASNKKFKEFPNKRRSNGPFGTFTRWDISSATNLRKHD